MAPRFHCPELLPESGDWPLPAAVAHHALRVLRLKEGAAVVLFDGSGAEVEATLHGRGSQAMARILSRRMLSRESPLRIVLVQALASADKMDWVVQKAVELGVARVQPVRATRSVLKLTGERAEKRLAHWREVAVSACEQSGRNRVPLVADILDLQAYLAEPAAGVERWVLDPAQGRSLSALAAPQGECHVLIGPEGGWSEEELQACQAAACTAVTLGPRVLRTETAGLAMLAGMQALWGDF